MRKPSQVIDRSRRELMTGAGAAGLAGLFGGSVTARAAEQSQVKSVDVRNLKATLQENLAHVLRLIDNAQGSAEEWGGERAKPYGHDIAFGCYAREKDWPRHVINAQAHGTPVTPRTLENR